MTREDELVFKDKTSETKVYIFTPTHSMCRNNKKAYIVPLSITSRTNGHHNPNLHLMKSICFAIATVTIVAITSCGLTKKEKTALLEAQQAKDDSVRIAQVNQVEKRDSMRVAGIKLAEEKEAMKSALADSVAANTRLLNLQQNAMIQLRTNIYTANGEMTQIKAFHFGRLPKDKEDQIRNQELKIQSLVMAQTNLQTAMQTTTDKIRSFKTDLQLAK